MWKHKLINHPDEMKFKYNKADESANKDLMFNILAEQSSNVMEEVASLQKGVKESFIQFTTDVLNNMRNMEEAAAKRQSETSKIISDLEKKLDKALSSPHNNNCPVPGPASPT